MEEGRQHGQSGQDAGGKELKIVNSKLSTSGD